MEASFNERLSEHRRRIDASSKRMIESLNKVEDAKLKLQSISSSIDKRFKTKSSYLSHIEYRKSEMNRIFQGGFTEPAKKDFEVESKQLQEYMNVNNSYYDLIEQLEQNNKVYMEFCCLHDNQKEEITKLVEEAVKWAFSHTKNPQNTDWGIFDLSMNSPPVAPQ